jgi:hypothetical protein
MIRAGAARAESSGIAVLLDNRFPEAMAQPGLGGLLMGPLAAWKRFRGLPIRLPEYRNDPRRHSS